MGAVALGKEKAKRELMGFEQATWGGGSEYTVQYVPVVLNFESVDETLKCVIHVLLKAVFDLVRGTLVFSVI